MEIDTQRKSCPFCGEKIAPTAKKCRYCGEWLEKVNRNDAVKKNPATTPRGIFMRPCPECGQMVASNIGKCSHCKNSIEKFCPSCGTRTSAYKGNCDVCNYNFYPDRKNTSISQDAEERKILREMVWEKQKEKREDIQKAGAVLGKLFWEVIIVSVLWGIIDDWSWWAYLVAIACGYGLIFLGTFFRGVLIVAVSIMWGLVGAALLMWAWTGFNDSLTALWIGLDAGTYIIEAIIIFLVSLYIHRRGFKSMEFASE